VDAPVHPDCEPIAFLLGTWHGHGKGAYPTVEPFEYGEEVIFWHVGRPFLAYAQRAWSLEDESPLHAEMGYWRPRPEGRIELVLAHPTGVTEIAEGMVSGTTIELASTSVALASSAKEVTRLERRLELNGDVLSSELRMAAVGVPIVRHLEARLHRT
jgi:nitrobindin-like protein